MKYTWKRVKKRKFSKNCTQESKSKYKTELLNALESRSDVLFQDESHFSKAIVPVYGYSKVGEPCFITSNFREPAYTLIFAFSTSHEIFYKVYEGSMNKARMQWFLTELPSLPMVMDNLQIHKSVTTNGSKIFTPVAQPYANPVEIVFSKLKHEFRQLNASMPQMNVKELIDMSIAKLTSSDLDGAIKHVTEFVKTNY
jgi:transposase